MNIFAKTYRSFALQRTIRNKEIKSPLAKSDFDYNDPLNKDFDAEHDALELMKDGQYKEETLLDDDEFFKKPLPLGRSRPQKSLCMRPGWSNSRCSKARRKLAEWLVDFEWTANAQSKGAGWGFDQCKTEKTTTIDSDATCGTSQAGDKVPKSSNDSKSNGTVQ